ncbi:MAG: hypothetical protein ABIK31_02750 [candidate division WOR-3 bacterium]
MDISKLKVGDIGFSFNKRNIFSYLIWKFSTFPDYSIKPIYPKISHVFLYLGDSFIFEATIKNGVIITDISKYIEGKHNLIFKRHKNFTEDMTGKFYKEICKYYGKKYSKLQILLFLIKKFFFLKFVPDYCKEELICSELVVEIYNSLGLFHIKNPHMTTPYDIYRRLDLIDVEL